jgi:probable rRNA maturation factor
MVLMASDGPRQSSKDKPPALLFGTFPVELKLSAAEKRRLITFAKTLAARIAGGREFTCFIAGDRELLRLNSTFLDHDYPTDVLSFPSHTEQWQAESAVPPDSGLGEIAISIERAAAQANEFGHAPFDEIRILMLHGLLHLVGLDHEKDDGEMALAEQRWRAEFQLPQTLIARQRNAKNASRVGKFHARKIEKEAQAL